jgi:hypothetical protein
MSDLRKYARQTTTRLVLGAILLVFILGDGLIYLIYGKDAAIFGLLCLLGGMIPVIGIMGILWIMDYFLKRGKRDE